MVTLATGPIDSMRFSDSKSLVLKVLQKIRNLKGSMIEVLESTV